MSGPGDGKILLGKADIYLHLKGKSRATVTHIDIELDRLNDIIKPGENTYIGSKNSGLFIGLKKEMIVRAEKLVNKIYTASQESFLIKSRKVEVVGHGIDTDKFFPKKIDGSGKFKILFAGRISPIKDLKTLISAMGILSKEIGSGSFNLEIVGDAVDGEEQEYFNALMKIIKERKLSDCVSFSGGLRHDEMPSKYNNSDVLVNLSPTGGMDKAVLEAMSCGILVLAANETFKSILAQANYNSMFRFGDAEDFSRKIVGLMSISQEERDRIGVGLRSVMVKNHSLDNLIKRISEYFK